jgi:CBS domain-containing protein
LEIESRQRLNKIKKIYMLKCIYLLMKVEKIMNRNYKSIEENESIFNAVKIMNENKIYGLVVKDKEGKDVGLLSERSIIKRFIPRNKKPDEVPVKFVMREPMPKISMDSDVRDAATYLSNNGLERCAVVDDSGKVAGIITLTDISRYLSKESIIDVLFSHRAKEYVHLCPKCGIGTLEPVYNEKGEIKVFRCSNPSCFYEE